MLVSRTETSPELYDYSYKLASVSRRYVIVNHTDAAGRDHHGYMTGSYYIGIYGWCTPDEYVIYWDADGPCSYAANVPFNITISIVEHPDAQCSPDNITYPAEPSYPVIKSGVEYTTDTIACNAYTYFEIDVPDPCYNLEIVTQSLGDTDNTVAELAVGKYPNTVPTFDNLQWTSYKWGLNNLTIGAWDPK
jgi:hypothetical protein